MIPSLKTTLCLAIALAAAPGCESRAGRPAAGAPPSLAREVADPCALALVPHRGAGRIDREIVRLQEAVEKAPDPARVLERLGWLFVQKARSSFDPGYYKLAEASALCLEARSPRLPAALLLRGHALLSLHRFRQAEELGRELVQARGSALDHGLLGDALLEEGRLAEAAEAYQRMLDLKPCLQSYCRGAHLRWLKGDLEGARELARMAVKAGSPRDPEPLAWACTRLSLYELQAGAGGAALRAAEAALSLEADHAAAHLARGRVLMARGQPGPALESLRRAAALNPLPECRWALADALLEAGLAQEARAVEARLEEEGAQGDPRTFALYLATRGKDAPHALQLAEEELEARGDIFTHDARAWALLAAGRAAEARSSMERALAEGTEDARLFLHAGAVEKAAGRPEEGRRWLARAARIQELLLPSERSRLSREMSEL